MTGKCYKKTTYYGHSDSTININGKWTLVFCKCDTSKYNYINYILAFTNDHESACPMILNVFFSDCISIYSYILELRYNSSHILYFTYSHTNYIIKSHHLSYSLMNKYKIVYPNILYNSRNPYMFKRQSCRND